MRIGLFGNMVVHMLHCEVFFILASPSQLFAQGCSTFFLRLGPKVLLLLKFTLETLVKISGLCSLLLKFGLALEFFSHGGRLESVKITTIPHKQ